MTGTWKQSDQNSKGRGHRDNSPIIAIIWSIVSEGRLSRREVCWTRHRSRPPSGLSLLFKWLLLWKQHKWLFSSRICFNEAKAHLRSPRHWFQLSCRLTWSPSETKTKNREKNPPKNKLHRNGQGGDFVYLTAVSMLPQPSVRAALMSWRRPALVPATVDGARWELRGLWRFRGEFGLISRYRQVVLWAEDRSAEPARQQRGFCSHERSLPPKQTHRRCFYRSGIALRWLYSLCLAWIQLLWPSTLLKGFWIQVFLAARAILRGDYSPCTLSPRKSPRRWAGIKDGDANEFSRE